jgi:hypothetical protein
MVGVYTRVRLEGGESRFGHDKKLLVVKWGLNRFVLHGVQFLPVVHSALCLYNENGS